MITDKIAGDLSGKNVFISGGSRGLGLSIGQTFIQAGANVAFCGRGKAALKDAVHLLETQQKGDQLVRSFIADVSEKDQVAEMATRVANEIGNIDVLVCNAGILGPMGPFLENDLEEWIHALNINLLGSLYLIRSFLSNMIEQGHGKIIQLSGGGAASPLPGLSSYAASKAAVIRFIETLSHEYSNSGVDINGVAPGMLKTRLLDEMREAGPERVGVGLFQKLTNKSSEEKDSSSQACELIQFLASDKSNGITGRLISAQWDNWRHWPNHLPELKDSDLYTLRRIVGRDRGQTWGDV